MTKDFDSRKKNNLYVAICISEGFYYHNFDKNSPANPTNLSGTSKKGNGLSWR